MNRLARAQDRKFEGSEGYAMARRLWAVEEELRIARSTIASLGAEVGGVIACVLTFARGVHLHGTARISLRCLRLRLLFIALGSCTQLFDVSGSGNRSMCTGPR